MINNVSLGVVSIIVSCVLFYGSVKYIQQIPETALHFIVFAAFVLFALGVNLIMRKHHA
jgi:hypothetical protein